MTQGRDATPARKPNSHAETVRRVAWHPSVYAPTLAEIHTRGAFAPAAPPLLSLEEQALLDAVLAAPEQDEPRLRYADWLCVNPHDASGVARGKFIREQFDAFRRGVESPAPDPSWLEPFRPWAAEDIVFRRGFAEAMSLAGRSFISQGEGLFRMTPLREVRLVAVQHIFDELASCPTLGRLAKLDLWGNQIGGAGVEMLSRSAYVTQLEELSLARNGLDDAACEPLWAASWVDQLLRLDLRENSLSPSAQERWRARLGIRFMA